MLEQMTAKAIKVGSTLKGFGIKSAAYLKTIPPWRWKVYGAVAIALIAYLLWCKYWPTRDLKPGQVMTAKTPSNIVNMPTIAIQPKQIIVYRDKVKVIEKLGLPASEASNPQEHIQAAVDLPRLKYGGKEAVFINTTTGATRVEVKANTAPWFALEKGNAIGLAAGYSTLDGRTGKLYWNHDLARVKEVVVGTSVEGIARPDSHDTGRRSEGVIWLKGEWRFDWP